MKTQILRDGFQAGQPTAPQTVAAPDAVSDESAIQSLTEVIQRMNSWDGPLHSSPLFGPMDRDIWFRVTLLHAEHHLGFLQPKTATQ